MGSRALALPSHARHQRHRQQRKHNPHHTDEPHHSDKAQRHADLHARVPPYEAARAAMPTRAMTAPGGPMAPRKHIQASQDAAAMNANRNGSAARASRKRQIGKRGAECEAWRARQAGVPPSSANGMGVGISLSCAPARGAILRSRNYSLAVRNYSGSLGSVVVQTKAARRHAGGKCDEPFEWRPAWEAKRPLARYQIAGSAARTCVG